MSEEKNPTIIVSSGITRIVDQAEQALAGSGDCAVFSRGGLLVRIVRDDANKLKGLTRPQGAPVIRPAWRPWLREQLARSAGWVKYIQGGTEISVLPPTWVVSTLASRCEWSFRPLEGVVETPVFKPCGSILTKPGYDPSTGLVYDPGKASFPPIPLNPSKANAQIALAHLLVPFCDFPFEAESDRAVVVANILTLLARPAIAGPCPMFFYRANTPGSGKGLCADAVSIIATRRPATLMAAPREDEETRKRILSIGLQGLPVVLLDNVEGTFGSQSMAAALTTEQFSDRLLGRNQTVTVPMRTVFMGTGNNVTFRGDLGRRIVPCDMESREEHPEDRAGFKFPKLREYVKENQRRLACAGLTILRAYHLAGRPAHGMPVKGSFEAWDELIRGAVRWLDMADPLDGCKRIREDGDSDLSALRDALVEWERAFADRAVTAAEAAKSCNSDPELASALATVVGCKPHELNSRDLGYALRRLLRRRADGRWFGKAETMAHGGAAKWLVQRNRGSDTTDVGDD